MRGTTGRLLLTAEIELRIGDQKLIMRECMIVTSVRLGMMLRETDIKRIQMKNEEFALGSRGVVKIQRY